MVVRQKMFFHCFYASNNLCKPVAKINISHEKFQLKKPIVRKMPIVKTQSAPQHLREPWNFFQV